MKNFIGAAILVLVLGGYIFAIKYLGTESDASLIIFLGFMVVVCIIAFKTE